MDNPFFRQTLDEEAAPYIEDEGVLAETRPLPNYDFNERIPQRELQINKPRGVADIELVDHKTPFDFLKKGKEEEVEEGAGEEFKTVLQDAENAQREGWDGKTWKPHKSLEEGNPTIAYGHVLTDDELEGNYVKIGDKRVSLRNGLTEEDAQALFEQDLTVREGELADKIDVWKDLPRKYKDILLNISYNAGIPTKKGWPKLYKAMAAGDDAKVREEMLTWYTPRGKTKKEPLTNRRDMMANAILGPVTQTRKQRLAGR